MPRAPNHRARAARSGRATARRGRTRAARAWPRVRRSLPLLQRRPRAPRRAMTSRRGLDRPSGEIGPLALEPARVHRTRVAVRHLATRVEAEAVVADLRDAAATDVAAR